MGLLSVVLLIVFAVASLLLIGIILIQDEQGEGLGGLFGGGGGASFGSRSGNILTKATSILGAVFLVGAFTLAWLNKTPEAGDVLGAARRGAATEQSVESWWIIDDSGEATDQTQSEDESAGDEANTGDDGDTDTESSEASSSADTGTDESSASSGSGE